MCGPENGTRKWRIIDIINLYIAGILKISSGLGEATCDVQEGLAEWHMNEIAISNACFCPSQ